MGAPNSRDSYALLDGIFRILKPYMDSISKSVEVVDMNPERRFRDSPSVVAGRRCRVLDIAVFDEHRRLFVTESGWWCLTWDFTPRVRYWVPFAGCGPDLIFQAIPYLQILYAAERKLDSVIERRNEFVGSLIRCRSGISQLAVLEVERIAADAGFAHD